MKRNRFALVAVIVIAAFCASACAGTLRDNVRKGALMAGEVALNIDQTERDIYAAGVYDAATHKRVGAAIVTMLESVRAYERAAKAWPEGFTLPQNVADALAAAVRAINTVEAIVVDIPGTEKLRANLEKIKTTIGGK